MSYLLHVVLRLDGDDDELGDVMDALDDGEVKVAGVELRVDRPGGLERVL